MTRLTPSDNVCPICGSDNHCAVAQSVAVSECWCDTAVITDETIGRVPEELRGKVCICPRCAGPKSAQDAEPIISK